MASTQVPENANVAELFAILIQLLLAGVVSAMTGAVLFTMNVALGPFAVSGLLARSDQAVFPTVILAVPLPVQPVMVTVRRVAPAPVVVATQPALVPFTVIPALMVALLSVPRLTSVNVRV